MSLGVFVSMCFLFFCLVGRTVHTHSATPRECKEHAQSINSKWCTPTNSCLTHGVLVRSKRLLRSTVLLLWRHTCMRQTGVASLRFTAHGSCCISSALVVQFELWVTIFFCYLYTNDKFLILTCMHQTCEVPYTEHHWSNLTYLHKMVALS